MELPVFFPNVKQKSTKDLIIRILSENRLLTNQVIFARIKSYYAVSVTYQAVRQALSELAEEGVLKKDKKFYSISENWIQSLHGFSTLLKDRFLEKKEVQIIDQNTKEVTVHSLNEMGHLILYGFKDNFFDMNNDNDLYMFMHHLWFPFFDERKRQMLRDFFSKNKNFIYVAHKGIVNRVFSVFYKRYGTVKLGATFDEFFDLIIQGDCIAKIYMPSELRKRMDSLYKSRNPFSLSIIDEFSKLTYARYNIKILITRDKEMVREIKSKMIDKK